MPHPVQELHDRLQQLGIFRDISGDFQQQTPDAFDDTAHHRDQRKDQDDQQHALRRIVPLDRILAHTDADGQQIPNRSRIAHERNHADHRIDDDLADRLLFIECAFERSPAPLPDFQRRCPEILNRPAHAYAPPCLLMIESMSASERRSPL